MFRKWGNLEKSVLTGMSLSYPYPLGSGICVEEETQKEPKEKDECKERVSSRQNRDNTTHINSQRLWEHTQDGQKFKPDKIPALKKGSRSKVWPTTKKLFAIVTFWEKKNPFLQQSHTEYIYTPGQIPCPGILHVFVCFLFCFGV